MILALFVAVLGAVVLLTGLPLLRPVPDEEIAAEAPPDPGAAVNKVLSALNEVEYDYRMNKLSEQDYQELHTRYSRKAVDLIQELEQAGSDEASDEEADMEAEIEAALLAASTGAEVEAEAEETPTAAAEPVRSQSRAPAPGPKLYCHHCGAKLLQPGQTFCQACGMSLEVAAL